MRTDDDFISPWLGLAHRTALLLHGDPRVADEILRRARSRLDAAADAQRKRLYYTSGPAQKQCKTYFPAPALLQMLVYAESEPFERLDERTDQRRHSAAVTRFALRYVKHLVSISARRNSFHVALALCRLLFNYATAETMAVYDSVLHEHDFVKEDYYYRARKRLLMREIEQRFPGLARVQSARAGERFHPLPEPQRWMHAVLAALEICTPWGTSCADASTLAADQGQEAELARLHALIHPPCFRDLLSRGGLDAPQQRLALPQFRHSENDTVPRAEPGTMTRPRSDAQASRSTAPV